MEFGRIDTALLDTAVLELPEDAPGTADVLKSNKRKIKHKVFVGCAKWGRKDWIGKIYPKGTKEKDFLAEYAKHFNCIEFNSIFYRLPPKEDVNKWRSQVSNDFLFCPKFTQIITHLRRLKNVEADTDHFLSLINEFGPNLGPLFLMPHPQMGPKRLEDIKNYISGLPKDLNLFLELRHKDWFTGNNLESILGFCEENKIGTVITDSAGRRDCVHMRLTTPEVFIRFVGNSLHETDFKRIDDWVLRIKKWLKEGIHTIYFFMHQHDELFSPELVKYLIDELNDKCKLKIKPPEFVS